MSLSLILAGVLLSTASLYLILLHGPTLLVICHAANNACPVFPNNQQLLNREDYKTNKYIRPSGLKLTSVLY